MSALAGTHPVQPVFMCKQASEFASVDACFAVVDDVAADPIEVETCVVGDDSVVDLVGHKNAIQYACILRGLHLASRFRIEVTEDPALGPFDRTRMVILQADKQLDGGLARKLN